MGGEPVELLSSRLPARSPSCVRSRARELRARASSARAGENGLRSYSYVRRFYLQACFADRVCVA
eukprot:3343205-Pleurochrysis_carterae.AAC.3